jgi:glutamine amidotransferase
VHSYAAVPAHGQDVLGEAEYGERFATAIERPPLYGVQFHPEKSSAAGLRLLANFARICSEAPALARVA